MRRFLELTENPVSGKELGVLVPPEQAGEMWFVIFEFNSIGYVKDDEKDDLDAKAILESIKTGTEHSNEERRKRGWATMDILGWYTPPRYDPVTNNLTWAIRGSSEGDEVVNYSVRLLGRKGVMDVDLVLNPTQVAGTLPEFDELMNGFEFTSGNRYAEFLPGDKVAQYGLTALVAGGAGAALAKSGLLAKMWKFLVFGAIAAFAAFKRVFGFPPSPRTRRLWCGKPATRSPGSIRCVCSGPRIRQASSASRSRGCIPTISAPSWTRAGWRSGRGTIAPSR